MEPPTINSELSTPVVAVHQCGLCHRQHDGAGHELKWRIMNPLPENFIQPCGLQDCEAVMRGALEREAAKRRQKIARRQARQERQEVKKECRSIAGQSRAGGIGSTYSVLAASEDDFSEDDRAALVRQHLTPNIQPGPARSALPARHERQAEFVASGKADSANEKLVEFFEHALRTGQVGHWFSRHFLKEICGNDYINNRVDDMRPLYAERGVKIVQGEVSPDGVRPKASHYRLLLMSDAEATEYERTKLAPTT